MRACWWRRVAALTATIAVVMFEIALYRSETYPPALGLSLAIVGTLFLGALALLHQIHAQEWSGLARFGFAISAAGLGVWIVGGAMNALGLLRVDSQSTVTRFMLEVVRGPQAGWGLFCVGLVPIGVAATTARLSLPMRLLLPIGGLFALGPPLKYLLGDQVGGMTVLAAFGAGWLISAILLFLESKGRLPRPKRS